MASEAGVRTRSQKTLKSVTLDDESESSEAAGILHVEEQVQSGTGSPPTEEQIMSTATTTVTTTVPSTTHPALSAIKDWERRHPYSRPSGGAVPKPNQYGDGIDLFADPVSRPPVSPPLWSFSNRSLSRRVPMSNSSSSAGAFSSGQESVIPPGQEVMPPRGAPWSLGVDRPNGEYSYRIRSDSVAHPTSVNRGANNGIHGSRPLESKSFKLHLPSFNGKGKWLTFIRQFESITHGWKEEDKLHHLIVCLADDAADYVFELDQTILDNYELLVEELHRRFHVKETRLSYSKQFYSRHLNKGETIIEFAADLKRLIRKAYPVGLDGSVMEEILMKQFFDGLDDEDVRYFVEYLKQPRTLDDAVDLLHEYDTCRGIKRDTALKRSVRNVRTMDYGIETVNAIDANPQQPFYEPGPSAVLSPDLNNQQYQFNNTNRGYYPPSQASQLYQPIRSIGASQVLQQQPMGSSNQGMQSYRNISNALASAPGAGMNQLTQAIQNLTNMFSQFLKTSTIEGQVANNRKGVCFHCGDTTHYVRDCPNKKVQTVRVIGNQDEIQDDERENEMPEN